MNLGPTEQHIQEIVNRGAIPFVEAGAIEPGTIKETHIGFDTRFFMVVNDIRNMVIDLHPHQVRVLITHGWVPTAPGPRTLHRYGLTANARDLVLLFEAVNAHRPWAGEPPFISGVTG